MKDVFAKVESDQRFPCISSIAVNAEGDCCSGSKGAAKRDNAKEDCGNNPGVADLSRPSKTHQTYDSGNCDRHSHDKAKFGFIQAAVASRHRSDNDIGYFARNDSSKNTANERRKIDQTCREGREVVS